MTASVVLHFILLPWSKAGFHAHGPTLGSHGNRRAECQLIWKISFPTTAPDFLAGLPQGPLSCAGSWDTDIALGDGSGFPPGCFELFDAIFLDSPLITVHGLYYIFKKPDIHKKGFGVGFNSSVIHSYVCLMEKCRNWS